MQICCFISESKFRRKNELFFIEKVKIKNNFRIQFHSLFFIFAVKNIQKVKNFIPGCCRVWWTVWQRHWSPPILLAWPRLTAHSRVCPFPVQMFQSPRACAFRAAGFLFFFLSLNFQILLSDNLSFFADFAVFLQSRKRVRIIELWAIGAQAWWNARARGVRQRAPGGTFPRRAPQIKKQR